MIGLEQLVGRDQVGQRSRLARFEARTEVGQATFVDAVLERVRRLRIPHAARFEHRRQPFDEPLRLVGKAIVNADVEGGLVGRFVNDRVGRVEPIAAGVRRPSRRTVARGCCDCRSDRVVPGGRLLPLAASAL